MTNAALQTPARPPERAAVLAELDAELAALRAEAEGFEVTDAASQAEAMRLVERLHAFEARVESSRKAALRPVLRRIRDADDMFRHRKAALITEAVAARPSTISRSVAMQIAKEATK